MVAQAGTPGSFRGKVVDEGEGSQAAGWLYVQGRDGGIRRVDISHATIAYDEAVPAEQRKAAAHEQLTTGAEVRVTAEQDSNGEWHASRVDILKPPPSQSAAGPQLNYVACPGVGSCTSLPYTEV